jgi:nuclear RNA export factor
MRSDRDGDLAMGTAVRGRGRIGKSTTPASSSRDLTSRISRGDGKSSLLSGTARSAILRQAASGDVSMKESRSTAPRGGLVELKITGWEKSKASSDADGGVSSLIKWLEKKASHRLGSRTRDVKVKKVCCRQRLADSRHAIYMLAATSGPPSFAANLRTTTAIEAFG